MPMREPAFWWRDARHAGWIATLLSPVAAIYGAIAASRMARRGTRAGIPVICIGNYTLGGAGKTPAVLALAGMLRQAGEQPALISRGYGGMENQLTRVDSHTHTAAQVGDEALLLARAAPTIACRDRVAAAQAARESGASVIVMDDGLQNASLEKDLTIAVVDGRRAIGNARVFPAGPLRAPLAKQIARTDAVIVVGPAGPSAVSVIAAASQQGARIFHAAIEPDRTALARLQGRKVLAYAGIGDPRKFFATLASAGIAAAGCRPFPDHHRFSASDARKLLDDARRGGLLLVTTEKDLARMTGDAALTDLAVASTALPVTLEVRDAGELRALVLAAIRKKT